MSEEDVVVIRSLEGRFREALRDDDMDTLAGLASDEYTFVSDYGIETRDQWLAGIAAEKKKAGHRSIVYEEERIDIHGDCAVFYAEQWIEFPVNDQMTEEWAHLVTDVWLRRGGEWKIARRHSSGYKKKNPSYRRQREHV